MIIQSETIMSVVSSLEKIADKSDDVASKYLANALRTASEENRTDLLNSEKNEYEVLSERAMHLEMQWTKLKVNFKTMSEEFQKCCCKRDYFKSSADPYSENVTHGGLHPSSLSKIIENIFWSSERNFNSVKLEVKKELDDHHISVRILERNP